jgi:hypothetical protein
LIDFPVIAPGIHHHAFKTTIDCLKTGRVGIVQVPFSEMYHFPTAKENIFYQKRWEWIAESYSKGLVVPDDKSIHQEAKQCQ